MKLKKKTEIKKPNVVYNLHIKNDHNYIANDAIVSNCHQGKANVLKKILTDNVRNAPIRWGLTGTVPKEDFNFEAIHAGIGPVVNEVSARELQEKGFLSNCHINVCQLIDTKEFQDYQSELKYLVTDPERMDFIGEMVNQIKESGNTLVLVDRIPSGELLHKAIPGSVFISGEVETNKRQDQYDEINTASNKVIIATYGVASTGIDIPRIFNLVLLEPGKSFIRVIQSIGRGVRKANDKDFVQIWDVTSTCKYAKRHLTQRKKYYKEEQYPFKVEKIDWSK